MICKATATGKPTVFTGLQLEVKIHHLYDSKCFPHDSVLHLGDKGQILGLTFFQVFNMH